MTGRIPCQPEKTSSRTALGPSFDSFRESVKLLRFINCLVDCMAHVGTIHIFHKDVANAVIGPKENVVN